MTDELTGEDVKQDRERLRISKETEEIQRETASAVRSDRKATGEWYKDFIAKPFGEFVVKAYEFNVNQAAKGGAEWHSELFWFAWVLRGHPEMRPYLKKPKEAFKILEGYLKRWSEIRSAKNASPPYGFSKRAPWREWFGVERADAAAEFTDVWLKSRFMPGHDPIEQAADASRRMRLIPDEKVVQTRPVGEVGDEDDYGFFLSIAGHLQVAVGDQNIKLPCEKVAAVMKVSPMTISRYRRWAQEDGYLFLKKAHKFRSKGQGDATEFRFAAERWPFLEKRMVSTRDCDK